VKNGSLSALLIGAILSGCLARLPPVALPAPRAISRSVLGDLYQKRRQAIGDFKGRLTVTLSSPRLGRQSFHATWFFERGTTTLRGFNLFGQSLFSLTLSASEVSFVPARGEPLKWNRADPPPEHPTFALVSSDFIGQINRAGMPDLSPPLPDNFEKMETMFHLVQQQQNGTTLLHRIDPASLHVTRTERFDTAGQMASTLIFGDYREIGKTGDNEPVDFPFVVKGETEAGIVTLTFEEVRVLTGDRVAD
jgi:hypothetical protein